MNPSDDEPLDLSLKSDKTAAYEPESEELLRMLLSAFFENQLKNTLTPTIEKPPATKGRPPKDDTDEDRRNMANARERKRVQRLSDMFENLRSLLPVEESMRISKLAILKVSSAYIALLAAYTKDNEKEQTRCQKILENEVVKALTLKK